MDYNEYELELFEKIKDFFRKKRQIEVGDIGIYQDVMTVKTNNIETSSLYYDIFVKIKAVGVYKNLIEIETMDIFTINASNQNVLSLIEANIPKYIHPRQVKWEIKSKN